MALPECLLLKDLPTHGLRADKAVRDQDRTRINALVAERFPLPGSDIARELQFYF